MSALSDGLVTSNSEGGGLAAVLLDLVDDLLQLVRAPRAQDELGALARQQLRGRLANSGRCAGDNHDLVFNPAPSPLLHLSPHCSKAASEVPISLTRICSEDRGRDKSQLRLRERGNYDPLEAFADDGAFQGLRVEAPGAIYSEQIRASMRSRTAADSAVPT
jgi:hypothetical protein